MIHTRQGMHREATSSASVVAKPNVRCQSTESVIHYSLEQVGRNERGAVRVYACLVFISTAGSRQLLQCSVLCICVKNIQ